MGKYMKKSKITADVAVMELSPQSSIGVRTRAKTLALQRLQKSPPATVPPTHPDTASFSYLQLRSRRLEKPPLLLADTKKEREGFRENYKANSKVGSRLRVSSVNSGSAGSVSLSFCEGAVKEQEEEEEEGCFGEFAKGSETEVGYDVGVEASFGEDNLDFEARDRSARESTPCSLIRSSDNIGTPGSTTRRASSTATNQRVQIGLNRNIPTTHEIEEFFTRAEQQQQRLFIEKYNFDIVNDLPLPGRYEWVQIIP